MPTPGDIYYATLFQPGADEDPVTGLAVDLAVRRVGSSTVWYDWIAAAWDSGLTEATLGAEHRVTLTDNGDGTYSTAFDQATIDASANQTYLFIYRITTAGYESRTVEQVDFRLAGVSAVVASSASSTSAADEDALEVIRYDPVTLSFVCTDSAGTVVNITGHTLYFTVKTTLDSSDASDTTAVFQKTATITDGPAGECTVSLTSANTAALALDTTYYWDLVDITAGHVTYARGTIVPLWNVTNKTS